MILRLIGIENELELTIGISLLNIHNRYLYKSIVCELLYSNIDNSNNLVLLDENCNRIASKRIIYIHDLLSYEFDSKMIVEKIIKPFLMHEILTDINSKTAECENYRRLIAPLLSFVDSIDIDYSFKEELDISFYTKLIGLDFSVNNQEAPLNKIISILKILSIMRNYDVIIINRAIPLLNDDEILSLKEYCEKNLISILFIDYLEDGEVAIANNLTIGEDFGSYSFEVFEGCHC